MTYHFALDTTNGNLSYALFKEHTLIDSVQKTLAKDATEILAPLISDSLKSHSLTAKEIELIVSVAGPGGFSGVRVGTSFVTGFSYPYQTKIKTLTSLEALALSVPVVCKGDIILSILNAKRDAVYVALFDSLYNKIFPETVLPIQDLSQWYESTVHYNAIHLVGHGHSFVSPFIPNKKIISITQESNACLFGEKYYHIQTNPSHHPIYLRNADAQKTKK